MISEETNCAAKLNASNAETAASKMISPAPLQQGDKIAIVSPASRIYPEYIDGACRTIQQLGYVPVLAPHCKDNVRGYAGTAEQRLSDFHEAIADPSVRAVLCSRGGYGVTHLLENLDINLIAQNPKWVIGFSDISALHAAMNRAGVMSVHASMAKHLAEHGIDNVTETLFALLRGGKMDYQMPAHPLNTLGVAEGTMVGGNMAVLCALAASPYDLLAKGDILFIEDIGEAIYRIERLLYGLRLSGVLGKVKGLVVGRFTECESPDGTGETMEEMIARMVRPYGIPTAFDFPCGHIDQNMPLIESSAVRLTVAPEGITLKQL